MEALLRYPPSQRRAKAQEWARRSHANRKPNEPDLYDAITRAKWDRKGAVICHGHTYKGDGSIIEWRIRWSVGGRSNQMDVVVNGRIHATAGKRRIDTWLKKHTLTH